MKKRRLKHQPEGRCKQLKIPAKQCMLCSGYKFVKFVPREYPLFTELINRLKNGDVVQPNSTLRCLYDSVWFKCPYCPPNSNPSLGPGNPMGSTKDEEVDELWFVPTEIKSRFINMNFIVDNTTSIFLAEKLLKDGIPPDISFSVAKKEASLSYTEIIEKAHDVVCGRLYEAQMVG